MSRQHATERIAKAVEISIIRDPAGARRPAYGADVSFSRLPLFHSGPLSLVTAFLPLQ